MKFSPQLTGYRKCRENWPSYALPYERPYNLFLDLVLLVLPLVILSVAYTLITRTLYVGMRIEKAMIFGGGSCNGKINSEEMYSTFQRKTGGSYGGNVNMGKGAYFSTTTETSSSTTTLASTSSSMSRFKFKLSLRRHGRSAAATAATTKINTKHNGVDGAAGVVDCAVSMGGVGGFGSMRTHYILNKAGNSDHSIQETDIFQQKHQQQQKMYHHPQQYNNYSMRQNHCHYYHQHHEDDHDNHQHQHHHQTMPQNVSNKLCCGKFFFSFPSSFIFIYSRLTISAEIISFIYLFALAQWVGFAKIILIL